jgi:hypothetical protein
LVLGVSNKKVIFNVLLMIMQAQFTLLLSKFSGLQRKQPTLPTVLCTRGWGFTASFQLQDVALVMVLKQ